jgi:hypothetical protein
MKTTNYKGFEIRSNGTDAHIYLNGEVIGGSTADYGKNNEVEKAIAKIDSGRYNQIRK